MGATLLQLLPCRPRPRQNRGLRPNDYAMAGEIFGTAALFWLLIPVGLLGGLVVLKFQGDNFEN